MSLTVEDRLRAIAIVIDERGELVNQITLARKFVLTIKSPLTGHEILIDLSEEERERVIPVVIESLSAKITNLDKRLVELGVTVWVG